MPFPHHPLLTVSSFGGWHRSPHPLFTHLFILIIILLIINHSIFLLTETIHASRLALNLRLS